MIEFFQQTVDLVVAQQDSLNAIINQNQPPLQHVYPESLIVKLDSHIIDSLMAVIRSSSNIKNDGISFTEIASLTGVIFGLSGLILGILNFFRDRAKVSVTLEWDHKMINATQGYDESKTWGVVTVTHIGRRPIYISHVAIKLPKPHTGFLLLTEGIKGEKLSEGDPPKYFFLDQSRLEKYAACWKKLRAQVSDTTGKVYLSKTVKSQPSWVKAVVHK